MSLEDDPKIVSAEEVKACCAKFYENELLSLVLGDSLHPGGRRLTLEVGKTLDLNPASHLLDMACGRGVSAVALAEEFGCQVTGTDISAANLDKATDRAATAGLSEKVRFLEADSERTGLPNGSFTHLLCECSLSTFPDRSATLAEMLRLLAPGGRLAITDVTISGSLPQDLDCLLHKVACVSGGLSPDQFQALLGEVGFASLRFDNCDYTLEELLARVKQAFEAWEILEGMCGCQLEELVGTSKEKIRAGIERAETELAAGTFGYGAFYAEKSR